MDFRVVVTHLVPTMIICCLFFQSPKFSFSSFFHLAEEERGVVINRNRNTMINVNSTINTSGYYQVPRLTYNDDP